LVVTRLHILNAWKNAIRYVEYECHGEVGLLVIEPSTSGALLKLLFGFSGVRRLENVPDCGGRSCREADRFVVRVVVRNSVNRGCRRLLEGPIG
jgi:hypothetical protein